MNTAYSEHGKRCLDVLLALLALIVLFPLLLLTACGVWLEDRGTILFRQRRIGRHAESFELLKFRSMPENVGDLASTDGRGLPLTRIGRILRRTNIDELPQLVNILKGEMSVVGPRPAIATQVELIELRRRTGALSARPGLTGLAQVSAYDAMPVTEKAARDAEYAATVSLAVDVKIILRTFAYLLRPPPVY